MVQSNSLALYKNKPARVLRVGDKITIEILGAGRQNVRPKDIQILHPGPFHNFDELDRPAGDIETAWEILLETSSETSPSDLETLSELIYGEFTPASAWRVWLILEDRIYFEGAPEAIVPRSREAVAQKMADQARKAAAIAAWEAFLKRARQGKIDPGVDGSHLREVEELAYGRRDNSRVLQALGHPEQPEVAHRFLLEVGAWTEKNNPHPVRNNVALAPPEFELPDLVDDPRIDLTHVPAFAIDDRDNRDPDDAISWDGDRLWVHIADAAAVVTPDTPMDLEARSRAATLYLPEGAVPMLPERLIDQLGLGLQDRSPALSFGLHCSQDGVVDSVEIVQSWVQVERLSYSEAETRLVEPPFADMLRQAVRYRNRRLAAGALLLDLPEVIIRVVDGKVVIRPVVPLQSRMLVREAMLMAGEGGARFATDHGLPFPFAVQDPLNAERLTVDLPDPKADPDLAVFIALRRAMAPGEIKGTPGAHAGIGLPAYSRVTSPLRRYLDLVAHQQIRAFLANRPPLDEQGLLARIGAAQAASGAVNRAESLSRRHWTLVFLQQNPGWAGEGVLVEKRGRRARVLIPGLAFEFHKNLPANWPLNARMELRSTGVNIPALEAYFEAAPH